jgi:hypothetical protein
MKKITLIFVITLLALIVLLWNFVSDTRTLNRGIKSAADEISQIKKEQGTLVKFKSGKPLTLEKFYLEVFNDMKELSFYYRVPCEVKIIGAKDLVGIRNFFKESQYKGIKYVDLLSSFDLRKQRDTYLLDAFYKMLKSRPLDVLDVSVEKGIVSITLRLYGT